MLKPLFLLIILSITNSFYSQQKATIKGKLLFENTVIRDALIELKINKKSKLSITDKNGDFKYIDIELITGDTLQLKVNQSGYEIYTQKLDLSQINQIITIDLKSIKTNTLDEVVVSNDNKVINKSNKSIYKIDKRDFIANSKADEVLSTIPNVAIYEDNAIVEGKLIAKIFIDGAESLPQELKTINVKEIDKIEVISNPSGSYGTDFIGAVINIITKTRTEDFLKGSLSGSEGLINNLWSLSPSLSYKKGRFKLNSLFSYKEYNSRNVFELNRNDNNNLFEQIITNNTRVYQKYFQTKGEIKFSVKSSLTLSSLLNNYKFVGFGDGFTKSNNLNAIPFSRNGEEAINSFNFAGVYKYKIDDKKTFLFKSKILEYSDGSAYNFTDQFSISNLVLNNSLNRELSFSADYEVEEFKLLSKNSAIYSGGKYIKRKFSFGQLPYFINQNIFNLNSEIETEWTDHLSSTIGLTIENTNNFNNTLNQNYFFWLPTISFLNHFKNKYDLKFGYNKRVLRPDANDLNDNAFINYPGLAISGNSKLEPQIRNYFFVSITKSIKKTNLSLKLYNESISNAIEDVYIKTPTILVQTSQNAAIFNSTGINFGMAGKLLKKLTLNFNSGFDHNTIKNNSSTSLINKVSGYTFRSNLFLSTKVFKDKISLSFNGMQNGPIYSLLSKKEFIPQLSFKISTNFFKDKLNLNINARNLLGRSASGFTDVSRSKNFSQIVQSRDNFTNILISLTFEFGKTFNENIENNDIENDDVKK